LNNSLHHLNYLTDFVTDSHDKSLQIS